MDLIKNRYSVQGVDLLGIVKEFGSPVYVYDAEKIKEQVKKMKAAFPNTRLKIKFACKSLTNVSILKLLRQEGVELDAVSIQEVQMG